MVDSVKRQLRDGVADGEHAPVILVRDSVRTLGGPPLFKHFLRSVSDNISRARAQATGIVVVALGASPDSYNSYSTIPRSGVKDCRPGGWFTSNVIIFVILHPLGWEAAARIRDLQTVDDDLCCSQVYRNIRDLDGLLSCILRGGFAGAEPVGLPAKERFVVFFDSISILFRYHSLQSVMNFFCTLRSHEKVSAVLCLVHADLHELPTLLALEYLCTSSLHIQPLLEASLTSVGVDAEGLPSGGEVLKIKQKRRNGRVREQEEIIHVTASGISYGVMEKSETLRGMIAKSLIPKVQFSLTLTENELKDRSKVVLPFEHQGNGQDVKIYDGRDRNSSNAADQEGEPDNLEDVKKVLGNDGRGEICYLRDSDNEDPDSDEDPDDDLDI